MYSQKCLKNRRPSRVAQAKTKKEIMNIFKNIKNEKKITYSRTVAAGSGTSGAGEQVSLVFEKPSLGVARK
jgi:hypothetical protein